MVVSFTLIKKVSGPQVNCFSGKEWIWVLTVGGLHISVAWPCYSYFKTEYYHFIKGIIRCVFKFSNRAWHCDRFET